MKVSELKFKSKQCEENTLWMVNTDLGKITVLHRRTGWGGGLFDTETGYKAPDGKFWLASDMFDIRDYPDLELEQAIEKIKIYANTCVGVMS